MNEVFITEAAYNKINKLVKAGLPDELSMFGEVEIIETEKEVSIKIINIAVPKQKRTGTTVEHVSGSYAFLEKQDVDPQKLVCWVHSHPNFSANPSREDNNTFKEMAKDSKLFVMLIVSLKYDWYCRILYKNFSIEAKLVIENIDNLDEEKKLIDEATVKPIFQQHDLPFLEKHGVFTRKPQNSTKNTFPIQKKNNKINHGFQQRKKNENFVKNKVNKICHKYFESKCLEKECFKDCYFYNLIVNTIDEACMYTCPSNMPCIYNCHQCEHYDIEEILDNEILEFEIEKGGLLDESIETP